LVEVAMHLKTSPCWDYADNRPSKQVRSHDTTTARTISELGISKDQSSPWRRSRRRGGSRIRGGAGREGKSKQPVSAFKNSAGIPGLLTKETRQQVPGVTASVPARHPLFTQPNEPIWREYGPITLPGNLSAGISEPHTGFGLEGHRSCLCGVAKGRIYVALLLPFLVQKRLGSRRRRKGTREPQRGASACRASHQTGNLRFRCRHRLAGLADPDHRRFRAATADRAVPFPISWPVRRQGGRRLFAVTFPAPVGWASQAPAL
jgi:hypothetical protein